MKIVIIDYGMGNVKSISSTLKYIGLNDVILSKTYEDIIQADKIILPGVGSFSLAMENIKNNKIDSILKEVAIDLKKPILGICLGMQLLGISSTEDGLSEGLGLISGIVTRLNNFEGIKIPHVGFNQILPNHNSRLFDKLSNNPDFYFTHSYKMTSDNDLNASYCEYGEKFVAGFELQNIAGVQFHPELSQNNGIQLLKNFINLF